MMFGAMGFIPSQSHRKIRDESFDRDKHSVWNTEREPLWVQARKLFVLFGITRDSIVPGIGQYLAMDRIIERLKALSGHDLPAYVVQKIQAYVSWLVGDR
jgi:hypothetical protein